MARDRLGRPNPHEDAARLRTIARPRAGINGGSPLPGPGITVDGLIVGLSGNTILLYDSGGAVVSEFEATEAGLIAAIAAWSSGDTILLPSMPITLSSPLANNALIRGISLNSILIGSITNTGTLENLTVNGNVTQGAGGLLLRIWVNVSSGAGITQAVNAAIQECRVVLLSGSTYGMDISDGRALHSIVTYTAGTGTGVYVHGADAGMYLCRCAGYIGGLLTQAAVIDNCDFYGAAPAPASNSHGATHAGSATVVSAHCNFGAVSANSYGLVLTGTGLQSGDNDWDSISGENYLEYLPGDRASRDQESNHANDIEANVLTRHLPAPTGDSGDAGKYPFLNAAGTAYELSDSAVVSGESLTNLFAAMPVSTDAGWCWFSDPRAVYYNGVTYIGFIDKSGNVKITSFNHATKAVVTTTLHATLEVDDHDNPSILIRNSDHKIIVFYSKHDGADKVIYYRVSSSAEDISTFAAEQTIDPAAGAALYSYTNPIQLTGETDEPIYLFYRRHDLSYANARMAYTKSDDGGATWSAQTLLADVTYRKIVRNGTERIDFVASNHPADAVDHGVYHFYYQGGNYYKSDGTQIVAALPFAITDMTQVYDGSSVIGWVWDIAIDPSTGYPVVVYATFESLTDHRYNYGRWTGTAWDTHEITAAGGTIYASSGAEDYYSGGVVLDHTDPSIVYLSKQVNGQFEVYRYSTPDGGTTWSALPITADSTVKNIRPVVVRDHPAGYTALYLSGTYTTYINYDLTLKYIFENMGSSGQSDLTDVMLKSVYDTDADGVVDNSEALETHPASYFATAAHTHTVGKYRQFVYVVSGGDFSFVIDGDGQPVMALQDLE